MADILTPALGESVSEATIARWTKKSGDAVRKDELLIELETDKVSLEVVAPGDGVLTIDAEEGAVVVAGQKLGAIGAGPAAKPEAVKPDAAAAATTKPHPAAVEVVRSDPAAGKPEPVAEAPRPQSSETTGLGSAAASSQLSPAVQRIVSEKKLDPAGIAGSGKDGRITKGDALAASAPLAAPPREAERAVEAPPRPAGAREERVRLSRLRQTIARRLKDAQNTAAMLTTFNEVDMSAVMAVRQQYKDAFEKRHGVKLGFMSFFVKAVVAALKDVPSVNAEIDGGDLVYKNHYDIGIAVGTEKGLVVPVLRDADALSLAGLEKGVAALGKKARDGQLTIEDMQGGTFSITNGGIYGSLMSTPILNAPQSGILGMHAIKERPIAVAGKIEIRPMMYLALSYDHRVVDGKEAVTFLVAVKDLVEDPQRLLLEL
jgi:2-oxoglutarate dehydrogenase E2 component (dihydrolipoamide succinyltransferase)